MGSIVFDAQAASLDQSPAKGAVPIRPVTWERRTRLLLDQSRAAEPRRLLPGRPLPPFWMTRRTLADILEQFRRGEKSVARIVRRLSSRVPHPLAARYLATQAAEEDAHEGLYATYIDRLGVAPRAAPVFAPFYDACLDDRVAPPTALAAVSILLEAETLVLHRLTLRWLTCPVLTDLTTRVHADEARHVAFANAYLGHVVPLLPASEQIRGFVWLKQLWQRAATVPSTAGIGLMRLRRGHMERSWPRHEAALLRLGFARVPS